MPKKALRPFPTPRPPFQPGRAGRVRLLLVSGCLRLSAQLLSRRGGREAAGLEPGRELDWVNAPAMAALFGGKVLLCDQDVQTFQMATDDFGGLFGFEVPAKRTKEGNDAVG